MHVIVSRDDLGTFAHLHAQPTEKAGEFTVPVTFPTTGSYTVHVEFRRRGQMADVLATAHTSFGDTRTAPAEPVLESGRDQVVDGVRVHLSGDPHVGGRSELTYTFTDAATGRPVTGLRPYLAAAGHIVVMPADGHGFAHEHAETTDVDGNPRFALPGQTFGPDLNVHAGFPRPGLYRLWGQFRLASGRVITTTFTVRAA
jgi:Cu+-exporting ATPase